MDNTSKVLAVPPADGKAAQVFFHGKLGFETDPADVYADMKAGAADFVLADVRSEAAFEKRHAAGAVHLPSDDITPERLATYPDDTVFVVYCWGPGCNGATKAALKLSTLGYAVKEMIGGIEYWADREKYPVADGR